MEANFIVFVVVGFLAQMIDGALGMAYGVSSNTFLLSLGIPPAAASASVHMAEVATTGISGFSHWKLGNVDWKLVKRLLVPGVIGGVLGAYVLTSIDGNIIKPYISAYLLARELAWSGRRILRRCRRRRLGTGGHVHTGGAWQASAYDDWLGEFFRVLRHAGSVHFVCGHIKSWRILADYFRLAGRRGNRRSHCGKTHAKITCKDVDDLCGNSNRPVEYPHALPCAAINKNKWDDRRPSHKHLYQIPGSNR